MYGNYFGNGYYQPPTPAPAPAAQTANGNGIVWVQGEAGAKSFLVAPGSHVLLMDSEDSRFYIKSADVSGVPLPLRVFKYTEELTNAVELPPKGRTDEIEGYVTRKEFEALKAKIDGNTEKESAENE